jgi:hypothetical protein
MADWKVVRRLAIAITMAVAIGCGSTTNVSTAPTPIPAPHDKGVVIGGIIPCQAIIMRGGPQYAPGTVTVLKGKVSWRSTGPGTSVVVFPTTVVAQASVTTNGTYLFTLDPGDYVLQAHFAPPANVTPFTEITVNHGVGVHVDIPNMCI